MSSLILQQTKDALSVMDSYPRHVSNKLYVLRQLVLDCAEEEDSITQLEETLKWGEPSYIAKKGSTIRIDWKRKNPDQYAIYFKCTSKLVETFREVYGDTFSYENNRAIVFPLDQKLPKKLIPLIKQCIKAALTYHTVKELPYLGIKHPWINGS